MGGNVPPSRGSFGGVFVVAVIGMCCRQQSRGVGTPGSALRRAVPTTVSFSGSQDLPGFQGTVGLGYADWFSKKTCESDHSFLRNKEMY